VSDTIGRWYEYQVDGYMHLVNWVGESRDLRVCDSATVTVKRRFRVGEYPDLIPYCQGCVRKVLEVTK